MKLHETKYYFIIQLDGDPDEFNWGVVNKEYNCIEHKCYSLPNAISVCYGLTDQLETVVDSIAKDKRAGFGIVHNDNPDEWH